MLHSILECKGKLFRSAVLDFSVVSSLQTKWVTLQRGVGEESCRTAEEPEVADYVKDAKLQC